MKEFDGLNLSKKQKSKLEKLLKERDAKMQKNQIIFVGFYILGSSLALYTEIKELIWR